MSGEDVLVEDIEDIFVRGMVKKTGLHPFVVSVVSFMQAALTLLWWQTCNLSPLQLPRDL